MIYIKSLILLLSIREGTFFYGCDIIAHCRFHILAQFGKPAQELGLEALVEPQHVMQHKHLPVAAATGSYAYSRYRQSCRCLLRQRRRNLFEDNGEAACLGQQLSIVQQLLRFGILFGTQALAAKLVN